MRKIVSTITFCAIIVFNTYAQSQQGVIEVPYEPCTNCQNTPTPSIFTYESERFMNTWMISSDYGRRSSNVTRWHKGLDLSPEGGDNDLGDHIIALESATITYLIADQAYKYIITDGFNNYGYAHIFRNDVPNGINAFQLGDMYLKRYDVGQAAEDEFAIIWRSANEVLMAYGAYPGTVTLDGVTMNVQTTIDNGEPIAPLGDALSTSYETAAHLHLYEFVDGWLPSPISNQNTKNPLRSVAHNEPDYSLTIDNQNIIWGYGANPSSIKVTPRMIGEDPGSRYYNNAMNIDEVTVEIAPKYGRSNFKYIEGPNYESRISLGGRKFGPVIYPSSIASNLSSADGSATTTGMLPFAYKDSGGQPYDEYYFSDFVTRINDNDNMDGGTPVLANSIDEARYPDGIYILSATASTVTGATVTGNFSEISIDNFRPYVKSVTILRNNEEGIELYIGDFNKSNSQVEGFDLNTIQATDNLYLEVEFSESMDPTTVSAHIESNSSGSTLLGNSVDQKSYYFTLAPLGTSEVSNLQTLVISGQDLAGHQLQADPSTFTNYKTGVSTWSNTLTPGNDENHVFNGGATPCDGNFDPLRVKSEYLVQSASTGECIYVGFEADKQNPSTYEPVVFSPVGSKDPSLAYSWNFGAGAIPATSSEREVTVMYETAGTKTVSLQICSGGNCATNEIIGFVDVGAANAPLTVEFDVIGSTNRGTNEEIYFTSSVSNNSGPLNYSWDFGFGATPSNSDQASSSVNYFSIGSKKITLTVSDDVQTSTITKGDFLRISRVGSDPINVTLACPAGGGRYLELDAFDGLSNQASDGVVGNEEILWEFDDGQISTSRDLWVEFKSPGLYDVKLTICDDSGCSTDVCQYRAQEQYYSTGNYNFTINGQLAGEYIGGSYQTTPIQSIAANFPLILNDATGVVNSSTIKYYIYKGNAPNPFMTIDDGPGPHEVLLPDPNSWYSIYYQVGLPGQNFVPFANIYADDDSQVSERCITRFGSIVLNETCWNDVNTPQFTAELETNGCPIGLVELIDLNSGQVLTTNNESYLWPISKKPTSFPYTTTIEANAYYDCGSGSNCIVLSTKQFEITINSFEDLNINESYQSCVGAKTEIGLEPDINYSYLWSSVAGSDLNYLSDITVSDPSFVAYLPGTYQYDLTVTDNQSGCASTERITIITSGIEAQSYSQNLIAGRRVELQSPVIGGGSDYEYEWIPDTYLDNPRVPNPIITVPDLAGNIDYTVKVSFRGESCKTDPNNPVVSLTFDNPAPHSLAVSLDGETPFPILEWRHEGVAGSYEIRRSVDGGSFSTIATVDGSTFEYQDVTSCDDPPGVNYCYKIRARNVNNQLIPGASNTECEIFTGVAEGYSRVLTLPSNNASVVLFRPDVQGLNYENFDFHWSPSTFLDDPNSPNPTFTLPNYGTSILYNVDISYQGICTASTSVLVQVENPPPTDFDVTSYGIWPNSQFPTIGWTENGIVNYYILYRSVDGGPYVEVTRGADIVDHIDFDCIFSTVEYCYKLEGYDYNDQLFSTVGPSCFTVPFSAGLTSDFPHSVDGSSYDAINKSSVFNGFGGNTIIPIQNFGNAKFGSVDAVAGSSVLQLDFRDAILDRVGPQTISNGSYDFWPTGICETDNYFFIVGAVDESGYENGILNLIRYTKSNGTKYRRRLKSPTGNYMKINAPALIADLGNDDFVVATSYDVGNDDVGVWSIMKPIDWTADTWEYEHYALTSSYDVSMSDLDIHNDIVYVTVKHRGISSGSEHFRSVGYEVRKTPGYPDRFDQEYYASASSQASVPLHPKSVFHSNMFYSVSEMGVDQIYVKQESHTLSRQWTKSFTLSQSDFEVKALEIFEGELFAVSQNGTSLLIVTFDLAGNKTSEKYFEIDGLDKILGATKVEDQVVINYTKNVSGGIGEVYSSIFGGDLLEISGDKRLCWWEATGNDIYNGQNFDVAEDCNFYVNDGQLLELNASNSIILHPGFSANEGSSVSLRINVPTPVEDCPPPQAGRVAGVAKSVEVEIVDDQIGENSLVGNIYAYPNPSRDWVSIAYVLQDYTDIQVTFFDIEGKQVARYNYSNTNHINDRIYVGDLAKGIYIVTIESEKETRELKISVK